MNSQQNVFGIWQVGWSANLPASICIPKLIRITLYCIWNAFRPQSTQEIHVMRITGSLASFPLSWEDHGRPTRGPRESTGGSRKTRRFIDSQRGPTWFLAEDQQSSDSPKRIEKSKRVYLMCGRVRWIQASMSMNLYGTLLYGTLDGSGITETLRK